MMADSLLKMIREVMLHGDFTLSSGEHSDIYCDIRLVSHNWTGFHLIGEELAYLVRDLEFDAVGGTAIGAIPVALSVADTLAINAFTVRAKTKDHGTQRLIEGLDIAGMRVLIVDDVITTGASVMHAVMAAEDAGATVVGIAVVLNRTGWRASIDTRHLYTLEDLR